MTTSNPCLDRETAAAVKIERQPAVPLVIRHLKYVSLGHKPPAILSSALIWPNLASVSRTTVSAASF